MHLAKGARRTGVLWSPKGPFCYYSAKGPPLEIPAEAPVLLQGASAGMIGSVWGPEHFQRAHLAAGILVCIPRKFTLVTPRKRVGGPRGVPLSLAESVRKNTGRTCCRGPIGFSSGAATCSMGLHWLLIWGPSWLQGPHGCLQRDCVGS